MVTHYTNERGKTACGRNNHHLVSTLEVRRVRCKSCLDSHVYQQGIWFSEFQNQTGTEPKGLREWAIGTMPFDMAAQHSLACYRAETTVLAERLERQLNPLII